MTRKRSWPVVATVLLVLAGFMCAPAALGEAFIVKDGRPRAEIVISGTPPRTAKLAAEELQTYLAKISGAKLPITTTPSDGVPVQIYVGQSPYTNRLNVTAEGLKYGAFRMVSGENWLVLLGHDSDFTPPEPWALNHGHWKKVKVHEWDKLTGAKWSNPLAAGMYRHYSRKLKLWEYDEHGSLNAVHAFLRGLGVRWYMPGELGEIVPRVSTIALPKIDNTVRPDFSMRIMNFARYFIVPEKDILWSLRLGTNDIYGESLQHHGIRYVTERTEQKEAHPEYYALYGGKRDSESRTANACLSSRELFDENVRFIRTVFDTYDVPILSVMPADGFTSICQCPKCKGKDTLERGQAGWFSDYVWDYVNRVAKEVYKTHPNKKIICGAYSTYRLPPLKIDKLCPNLVVQITNGRPVASLDPDFHKELDDLRKSWRKKTSGKLIISMNYPFTQRGEFRPCYFPHAIARGLRDAKGQVQGENIWLPEKRGLHKPGVSHLNAYVMARLWWDADLDVDVLLDEYYRLFYGPAAGQMKAFIEYSEANFAELTKSKGKVTRALGLFDAAKEQVDAESVYGRRIALVDEYLGTLRKRSAQLGKGRGPVPAYRAYDLANDKWRKARENFKIDGKLDEPFWKHLNGGLRDLQTGRTPAFGTRFHVLSDRDNLYFGIRCQDMAGAPANITTKKNGDPAIWTGDHIEILLETDSHSYYQVVINPAGAIMDLDRKAPKRHWYQWSSKAEVGAHVGKDYWSVEVRIPVTEQTQDPLHLVVGRRPSIALPWHFNLCRKRTRQNSVEISAFSPTGASTFHDVMKFGKLYVK